MDFGKITTLTLKNCLMRPLGKKFQDKIIVKMMKMMTMMAAEMFL